jgi:ELWxxDGT repeat protein
VFFAISATGGPRVWVSDGTPAGTVVVATIANLPLASSVWTAQGSPGIYWSGSIGDVTQLLHFGGTAGSIEHILNFPNGTTLSQLGSGNSASVFVDQQGGGYNSPGQTTLWVTYGSAASTLVGPTGVIMASQGVPAAALVATAGDELYFPRTTAASGTEVWHINTATGTVGMVADLAPGAAGLTQPALVALDQGRGVGVFGYAAGGYKLWTASPDGSRVRYLTTGTLPNMTVQPVSVGSRIFMAYADSRGVEPWVADLCPADYDNSGTVSTEDLFAYMNDWLAGDRNADFDNSGGTPTLADLLGYLNAWIVGCP